MLTSIKQSEKRKSHPAKEKFEDKPKFVISKKKDLNPTKDEAESRGCDDQPEP